MLVVTVVIIWLASGALFWMALSGLQLRFELASRKHALVPVNSVVLSPGARAHLDHASSVSDDLPAIRTVV